MMNLIKKLLIALLLIGITNDLFSQRTCSNVDLGVNKNFELFYAMYLSSKVDSMIIADKYSGFPLTTQFDFDLKRSYYSHFSKYNASPQVKFYYKIASQGFLFSAPFNALLRADSDLQITDSCYFKQLPIPNEARASVVKFINKLREFRDLSEFDDFYLLNKPLYDTIVEINKEKADLNNLVFLIEGFFGSKLNGYHVILSPMMWPGGISLSYMQNCSESLQDIYVCIGPKSIQSGIPEFGTVDEFKSTIVHEFIHPFIMYYCTKYSDQIQRYASLYNRDKDVYQKNGCPDWMSAINELLTRTVEIIINSNGSELKATKAIEYQSKNLGFSYIPTLHSAFDKNRIKSNREEYNFDTVFLNVLHSLEK